ncbi:tape measure protein [Siphonobacter sp.]|uniref:tape measure protein n=1 Tax=Siphonobacter sp. TaxID=1869184 RepID=UPI003B3B28A1
MSAIIRPEDLYNESEFQQSLKNLQASHAGLSKAIIAEVRQTAKEYVSLRKEIQGLANLVSNVKLGPGAVKQLTGLNEEIEKNGRQLEKSRAKIKELNDAYRTNSDFVEGAREAVTRLHNEIRQLNESGEDERKTINKLNNELRQYQTAIKTVETAQRAAKKSIDDTRGAYSHLSKQTKDLKSDLNSLSGATGSVSSSLSKSTKVASAMQEQILRNTQALKGLNTQTATSRAGFDGFAGSLGKAKSSLSPVLGSLTALSSGIIGVSSAFEALQSSVKVIATMERQNFALRNASSSTAEFNKNLQLTRKIALLTGAPLDDTVDALRKFTGATRGTSIEGDKARRIFEAFSNTFTANGASADEFTRATKALSDMMSKGTVSAEELKGQLGDALPGAVRIFAEAAGVSQRELLKMMQNGEILAEDILPKVAAQLEKTTGTNAQKNLQTISGSWEQVTTNVKLLIEAMNNDGVISGFFSRFNTGLGSILTNIRNIVKDRAYGQLFKNALANPLSMSTWAGAIATINQTGQQAAANLKPAEQQANVFNTFPTWSSGAQQKQIAGQKKALDEQVAIRKGYEVELKKQQEMFKADPTAYYHKAEIAKWDRLTKEAKAKENAILRGLQYFENAQRKVQTVGLGVPTDKSSPKKTVASVRSQIDSIPNALIGSNGKAELTKEQSKALKGLREEVLALYSTLSKGDVAKLNLDSLKRELNDLLYGEKKDNSAKKAATARQKEIRDQFKLIEGYIKDAQEELQKNILGADNNDLLEALRLKLKDSLPKLEGEINKGNQKAKTLLSKVEDTFRNKMKWLKPLEYDTDTIFGQALKDGEKFRKFIESNGFIAALQKLQKEMLGDSAKFEERARATLQPGGGMAARVSDKAGDQYNTYQKYQQESDFLDAELNNYVFIKQSERDELQKHLAAVYGFESSGQHKLALLEKEAHERRKKQIIDEAEIRQQKMEQSIQIAGQVGSAIFEVMSAYRQKELESLEKSKAHELELVGDNKSAQAKIEKEYARKEAEIRTKQAKADKADALFQIAINTAIGVSSALAKTVTAWMVPFIIASGAIQAATVLARPLPQFFKGTSYSPEGPAMVAEYGPELIQGPKGDTRLIEKPSIVNLEKGSKVKTAFETRQMLKTMEDAEMINLIRPGAMQREALNIEANRRDNEIKMMAAAFKQSALTELAIERAFGRALDARPEKGMIYDEKGARAYEKRKGQLTEYMNRKTGF